jgi:hypothetical protein
MTAEFDVAHELGLVGRFERTGPRLVYLPRGDDLAGPGAHHVDAVRKVYGLAQFVRYEHDRALAMQP